MFRSLRLGTAFGIGIYVHWSFLLLLLFVVYVARAGGSETALYALSLVLSIFGCVVLHELGHALMARRFGIGTRDITLLPIGGVARLEKPIDRPWAEFCIAIAGPAVNVVIAAGLLIGFLSSGVALSPGHFLGALSIDPAHELAGLDEHSFVVRLLMGLLAANCVLTVFNLIPAFPMDGGRVLRALLTLVLGPVPATEIAALLGSLFALLLAGLGILALVESGNPVTLFVAMFVFLAGQQELAVVRHRARAAARAEEPLEELPANSLPLDHLVCPPDPNFSGFTWDRQARVWIRWRNGRPVHACSVDPVE